MKFTQAITYIFMIIITFLTISFFENYFIYSIFDMFNIGIYTELIIVVFINIIINPLLTAYILKDFKFINRPWD